MMSILIGREKAGVVGSTLEIPSLSQDLKHSFMQLHANSRAFWFSPLIFSRFSS